MAWTVPMKNYLQRAVAVEAPVMSQHVRALGLYRRVVKDIPRVINVYDLEFSRNDVLKHVRALFEQHSQARDEEIIERLLVRAELDFEEVTEHWAQKNHVRDLLGLDVVGLNPRLQLRSEIPRIRYVEAPPKPDTTNPWLNPVKTNPGIAAPF